MRAMHAPHAGPVHGVCSFCALALSLLAGCQRPQTPQVPETLLQALSAADSAVASGGNIPGTFVALAEELNAYSTTARPVMRQADLKRLAMDVAAQGAAYDVGGFRPTPMTRWPETRKSIERVLAGENPQVGPRYQIDAPEPVRAGMARVEDALDRDDADGAMRAMAGLIGPMSEWAGRLPGMRAQAVMEVVERDLTRMAYTAPGSMSVEAMKQQWEEIRKRIAPKRK